MRVELGLNQRSLRRWQIEMARRLGEIPGLALGIRWSKPQGEDLPGCVETLLGLERVVHGVHADLTARAIPSDLSPFVGTGGIDPDIVIDISGGTPTAGRRRWRLTFDGAAGDAPIIAALLEGRAPVIAVSDTSGGAVIADARPGIDEDGDIASAFEAVVARTMNLVVAAVRGGAVPQRMAPTSATFSCIDVAVRGTKTLANAALARLSVVAKQPAHARTGWRFVTGPDLIDFGGQSLAGWQVLPDDGKRSYAQPFPIITRAQSWLFVTERNFALGKTLISAVKFGRHGPLGTPSPVFELPGDLSYPFVFEADGNIWMIPERTGGGSIDLYRASHFPGGWRHEACLVPDIQASAPTLFRYRGRWWLTAAVHDGGQSTDMLHLWSADDIRGPWRSHPANPVLINAAAAQAAGRVVERGGRLIRPVRDHSGRGGALALAEITRLDLDSFEQRILSDVAAGSAWPGRGIATLNRAGSLECVDGMDFAAALGRPEHRPGERGVVAAPIGQGEMVGAN